MHTDTHIFAIDDMGFGFSHIMGDVVNLVKVPIRNSAREHLLKRAANMMRQYLSIAKGVVCCTCHRRFVSFTLRGIQRRADQFTVRQFDPVALHGALKFTDIIRADLVSKPTRAAVDLDGEQPLCQPHSVRGCLMKDLFNDIDLDEVIACS